VQIWGDVDRAALPEVYFCPTEPPAPGHMGMLLSEIGPEPIVRLQAGGLKAGEQALRGSLATAAEETYGELLCL